MEVSRVARPGERDGGGAPGTGEGRRAGAALDRTEGERGRCAGRGPAARQPFSPNPLLSPDFFVIVLGVVVVFIGHGHGDKRERERWVLRQAVRAGRCTVGILRAELSPSDLSKPHR